MNYENQLTNKEEGFDECTIHGICSISPSASAIKSATIAYLQELAFYILKVQAFGAKNNQVKNGFIEIFSTLIPNADYSEKNTRYLISTIQRFISDVKVLYKNLCEQNNVEAVFFKSQIKLNIDFTIGNVVKQGQKYADKFKKNMSDEQKNSFEIILIILKSICLYMVELQDLEVDVDKYYEELLLAINANKSNELTVENLKDFMTKYSQIDNELMEMIFEARKKEFGEFIETEVLSSAKEGKSILVSGTNIKDLRLLLEATKDKGINVYTHGQMITGHTYPKLKAYPHLVGHYGKGADYYISDFSSFPGVIFLTKLSLFNIDKLCFCKFFTTDKITTQNEISIQDYDFEPLIRSTLATEGFSEDEPEKKEKVGINEQNYLNKIDEIANKANKKEIKNIFIIGVPNKIDAQIDYFKRFFKILKKDCFAITFYYSNDVENIVHNNIDYAFPYLYKAIKLLSKQSTDLRINVFESRCEPHTIPNLIYLRTIGVNIVFFYPCSPNLMNPSLTDLLLKWFDINKYTTAENDFKIMLK